MEEYAIAFLFQDIFSYFFFFLEKPDFSVFVDLEKFQPRYLRSELWSHKTSSFMHELSWSLL